MFSLFRTKCSQSSMTDKKSNRTQSHNSCPANTQDPRHHSCFSPHHLQVSRRREARVRRKLMVGLRDGRRPKTTTSCHSPWNPFWPLCKVALQRAEMRMVRWSCGVKLRQISKQGVEREIGNRITFRTHPPSPLLLLLSP